MNHQVKNCYGFIKGLGFRTMHENDIELIWAHAVNLMQLYSDNPNCSVIMKDRWAE